MIKSVFRKHGRVIFTLVMAIVFCLSLETTEKPDALRNTGSSPAFSSGNNTALHASMGSVTPTQKLNNSLSDSSRLTKTLFPVIKKSFQRYPGYFLFIFLGGFIIFALIRIIDPSFLQSVFGATLNINLLMGLFKEGIFGFNLTSLLLDLVCISMTGIYVQVFFFPLLADYFMWIVGFTAIAYILKLIVIQFLATVFMGRAEATVHVLMQLLFMRMLGLVLLPFLFFALYQPIFDVHILLRFGLTVIFIIYMVWLVRLFLKMKSVGKVNFLYLFLYLCTIELSTLAILLRNYIQ